MAKRAKGAKKRRGRLAAYALLALAALGLALWAALFAGASVVTVVHTEVFLRDLPQEFDGLTALFVSDIHVHGANTPRRAAGLFHALAQLKPDMLLLGGDYASESLMEFAFGEDAAALVSRRDAFFAALADFPAPLGKFAVAGECDQGYPGLDSALNRAGISLLSNEAVRISKGEGAIVIAGLEDYLSGRFFPRAVAEAVAGADCVIALTHNPDALPAISTAPAKDGGPWADVVLAGHAHGGQIRLGGYTAYSPSAYGEAFLSGWTSENGAVMLVSNGVGCHYVNARWGAPAQAYYITFYRRAE